jgi:predicted ATPase
VAAALSQEELAARSGLSARGISDLERGVRRAPRPETLRLLADALELAGAERASLIAAAHAEREEGETGRLGALTALPLPGSPLFGRDEERAALTTLLGRADVRLVTVTGTGGSGKTHLALDVAGRMQDVFRDGCVFVDLAPLVDPVHVMPTIATALGIVEAQGQPVVRTLIAALGAKRILLVLDNCEQVLEAAPDIATLLAACPRLTMLATSREALRLRGEREFPLAPLPVPNLDQLPPLDELRSSPSVALFTARAEASDPRFALTAANARAVATVCHRVDGIPLALELAAARVKLLSPEELALRLNRRLSLLTAGARDAPRRQRTLRDAIAWSFDLLAPREQELFRQLAVFVGGWTLDAAEAIANPRGDLDMVSAIGSLIDKSLVRVDAGGAESRYGMLETIHEFALEQLEKAGERNDARDRHADYFLTFAERGAVALQSVGQRRWIWLLEREHPIFREAYTTMETRGDDAGYLRLSIALSWFYFFRTYASEGLQRLQLALAGETGATVERAKALVGAGSLAYAVGDYADASRWLEEGATLAKLLGQKHLLASAVAIHGAVAEHLGDEAAALSFFESGLVLAQEVDDAWLIGETLPNLSDAAFRRGDFDLAERYALEAIAPIQASGNAFMESMNLGGVGQVALAKGDVQRAVLVFQESLRVAEEIESPWNVANSIACAAATAAAIGRDRHATQLLGAADAAREVSGHPRLPQFGLFDQTKDALLGRLGADLFQTEWDAGRALSVEAAVIEARAVFAAAQEMTP